MRHKPELMLWLTDVRGIDIPRDFALSFVDRDRDVTGVSVEDWADLESGPDSETYWDTWTDVCNNAVITDSKTGTRYTVWQDSDCWLVPEGMECNDDGEWYWPDAD